jgi:hypothetical protein
MACLITITSITGGTSARILTTIVVQGTSVDCARIRIRITTGGMHPVVLEVTPDLTTGDWRAVFTSFASNYICGGAIQVDAQCMGPTACSAAPLLLNYLNCVLDVPVSACPIIDWRQEEEDCISGSRIVTFIWQVTSASRERIHYRITEVPGDLLAIEGDIVDGDITYRYPTPIPAGSTKNFNFRITTPSYSHCSDPYPFHFTVNECPPTPPCPMEIFWADPIIGECNEDGTRDVIISVSFTAPSSLDAELLWNTELLEEKSGSGPLTLSNSGSIRRFPAGTTQRFRVVFKNGCTGDSIPVTIPECPCPSIDLVETFGDCIDSNRSLRVTYNITSSSPYEAQLFRDDETIPVDALSRGSGRRQLIKADNYAIGSTHRFKAKITFPFGCTDERPVDEVSIPGCSPSNPPDDEKLGCGLLRLFVVIAFALALIAVAIGFCIPAIAPAIFWIAAGLALAAIIALVLWLIFCKKKPCGWAYLLLWQTFLSAGIGVMYFSGCCPWIIFLGLGLLLASVPFIILWIKKCNKTFCQFAKEAASVLVGVVLPLIALILVIPATRLCVIPIFVAILTILVAVLTVYALRCDDDS